MRVDELRQRLVERIGQVAAEGDEQAAATFLTCSRAVLIALASLPEGEEVSVADLAVGTRVAALITGLHREHLRLLVRRAVLPATKENGEFEIRVSVLLDYMIKESKTAEESAGTILSLQRNDPFLWPTAFVTPRR